VETGVSSELTSQAEIASERVVPQSQETKYLQKLENKLADLIIAKRQLDEMMKEVIHHQ
jgi:cation transport regulator ChaC